MKAYRIEREIAKDGVLRLESLPFEPGERVEVIVLGCEDMVAASPASVRGKVLEYTDPTAPVADGDWDALS
jgi:hypothetical protein